MTIRKILVPFDASGYANRAFKKALNIAQIHNAEIVVASVIPGKYSSNLGFSIKLDKKSKDQERSFADKLLLKLKKTAEKLGLKSSSVIIVDSSVEKGLTKYAKSHKIDMIIMGSHGRTFFRKLVLGSVAEGVVNQASCPVLVVK